MPCKPADGLNIRIWLMFSLPKPFGPTVIFTLSPGTISVYSIAGVLSPVLPRRTGSLTTDFLR